ncbi:DUF4176 domain-containing protein [Pasteurellaceae bacterium LIM206]|nr:DUF4176 domain-containing protein [Pasteurellaceae bacterium LIM206]
MKYYPLGTVVRVGGGEDLLMIITRLPLTVEDGITGYFDYAACIYPVGVDFNSESYFFNHEDIVEVLFEGYINPLEEKIQQYYDEHINTVKYPKFSLSK